MNKMALSSARMLSVEEACRYAGGFDDPARLAATFAGATTNIGDNGIVVRGNAPKFLQWRLEDVEIPNPNHFAEVAGFGSGGLTALGSQVLGNSDFMTGTFPAEYGNALSGVFDIKLRTENTEQLDDTSQSQPENEIKKTKRIECPACRLYQFILQPVGSMDVQCRLVWTVFYTK